MFNRDGVRHKEVIKPHPALARLYRATRRHQITFDANLVPMVSPPLPWTSHLSGGYLMSSAALMRVRYVGEGEEGEGDGLLASFSSLIFGVLLFFM